MSEMASNIKKKGSPKSSEQGASSNNTRSTTVSVSEDNACVVCFKNLEIFSIGECDHPVCYECSTRMRVLCQQNECPICRQVLSKVIFTYDKLPYRELEAKNRSEYYSKKYKIGFYTSKIQQAFFDLLDHQCPKCNVPPYRTFNGLKAHVRKEHDLHYCDLCTDHLKIFTFERRCYTQAELGLHRVKGDADNKSHRGHPLCEYCNCRYLDRDELFRHLRRDHYFCHFCDADGYNDFYKDYDALAEHFRQDHFLCEEGKCATEQFTGAFRTEIDYKAHVANVHGKSLNKQQVKQARTLQLEITLGRRVRPGQSEQGIANMRSRGNEDARDDPPEPMYTQPQHNSTPITIDAQNEQDFPSLAGASGPTVSLIRPAPISMRNRSGAAGLARTKENFPALGGGGGPSAPTGPQRPTPPMANALKKSPSASTGAISRTSHATTNGNNNTTGMIIHVSNRPSSSQNSVNNTKKSNALDFPALPSGKSKKAATNRLIDEDMLPSTSNVPMANVSAKHRTLVDDYVSVANPSTFQKIQLVQKEELEAKARKAAAEMNAPKLTSQDFPSLGGSSSSKASGAQSSSWVKAASEKKQRENENRKSKVAPAPVLPKSGTRPATNSPPTTNNNVSMDGSAGRKDKKNKEKKQDVPVETGSKSNGKITREKNNNNENKSENANINKVPSNAHESAVSKNSQVTRPPPGFSANSNGGNSAMKPPPGFHSNVIVNSVAKSPNNLTFTSSLGESYSIVPTHSYIQPPEAITRNQKLVGYFKDSLRTPEALEEFRSISKNFRDGVFKASAYYEHCQSALKDKFDKIFPELLALLPDINKQQALYLVHTQRLRNLSADKRKSLPKLDVCSTCKQVLLAGDLDNHRKLHNLKDNFPTLGSSADKVASGNRK